MSKKYHQTGTDSVLITGAAAATAELTANLDCQSATYATIRINLGAEANTDSTNVGIAISESDDTVVTNFATFDATLDTTVDNTAAVVATRHIALNGRKRYLRLTVTPDTTTNGAVAISAIGSLSNEVTGTSLSGDQVAG